MHEKISPWRLWALNASSLALLLKMTDLQLCEHSVFSLREKRASEWIQQQFERQCKQGFLDCLCCVWFVSSVLRPFRRPWSCYVFIYLFVFGRWPTASTLPRPSSPLLSRCRLTDGRHAQRSAEFYLFDSDTQFTGMQVNSSKVRLTFWISSLVLILLFISIYLFIFIRHYY